METPELFITHRLLIRRWELSDAKDVFNTYASKEERVHYISWKAQQSFDDTLAFLEVARQNFESGKDYAITLKDSNILIGSIGMVNEGGRVIYIGEGF